MCALPIAIRNGNRAKEAGIAAPPSPLPAATIQKLAMAGFVGALSGRQDLAEEIFQSLRTLCPANAYADIGIAMVWILADKAAQAASLLDKVAVSTDDERAMLAVCQGLAAQKEGLALYASRCLQHAARHGGPLAASARILHERANG